MAPARARPRSAAARAAAAIRAVSQPVRIAGTVDRTDWEASEVPAEVDGQ
jgi:hypothetical protein